MVIAVVSPTSVDQRAASGGLSSLPSKYGTDDEQQPGQRPAGDKVYRYRGLTTKRSEVSTYVLQRKHHRGDHDYLPDTNQFSPAAVASLSHFPRCGRCRR